MGFLDAFRTKKEPVGQQQPVEEKKPWIYAAAQKAKSSSSYGIYENQTITVRGEPTGYDFDALMRAPQTWTNLTSLYQLAGYYKETDPMYGGAIKNVYVPFSVSRGFRLTGASESTKAKYMEHYERIGMRDKMVSIFDQLYTYSNVFVYLMPDGNIITLQPNRCIVSEISIDGEPLINYDTQDLMRQTQVLGGVKEGFVSSFETRLKGLPPEVAENLKSDTPSRYVQLDPENTFVLQAPKPEWARYSAPSILPCLSALSRKALIGEYEKAQLQFGIKGFLHVKVGDRDEKSGMNDPDNEMLVQMYDVFDNALQGGKTAVTPWYVNADFITVDTKTLFDNDKYGAVNSEILAACGISGIIVNGQQESGSYGEAKLSLQTTSLRIKQNQDNFKEMMKKINIRLADRIPRISTKNIPVFEFPDVDLANDQSFLSAVKDLWTQGLVSNQTLLETYGLDITQELERKKDEVDQREVFTPPQNAYTSNTNDNADPDDVGGRPEKSDSERDSDPAKSETGKQPKPSNPDGS